MKVRGGGAERGWPPLTEDPAAAVQAMDHGVDRPFGQGKRGENIGAGTAPRPSAVGAPAGDRAGWEGTGPPLRPLHRALMAAAPPRRPLEQGGARGLPARPRWVREGLEEDQLHGAWRGTSTWWKAPTSGLTPPPDPVPHRRADPHARPKVFSEDRQEPGPSPGPAAGPKGADPTGRPPLAPAPPQARAAKASANHPTSVPSSASTTRRAALKRRSPHGASGAKQHASSLRHRFASASPLRPRPHPSLAPPAPAARSGQRPFACFLALRAPLPGEVGRALTTATTHPPARPPLTRPAACVARPRPRHCTRPSPRPAR